MRFGFVGVIAPTILTTKLFSKKMKNLLTNPLKYDTIRVSRARIGYKSHLRCAINPTALGNTTEMADKTRNKTLLSA